MLGLRDGVGDPLLGTPVAGPVQPAAQPLGLGRSERVEALAQCGELGVVERGERLGGVAAVAGGATTRAAGPGLPVRGGARLVRAVAVGAATAGLVGAGRRDGSAPTPRPAAALRRCTAALLIAGRDAARGALRPGGGLRCGEVR
ncbi:hypothetical protein ACIGG9_06315 [Pseudonocardia alni]|uniref:hypothetical protein n=1 Tax=Pseudonocardia alni TaxID=33907 RepID=UPI0033C9BDF4